MSTSTFVADFHHIVDAATNKKPERLPIYEHIVCTEIMEKIMDVRFGELYEGGSGELREFFTHFGRFFQEMTYDTISYEVCVTDLLPGGGALLHPAQGSAIKNRADFEAYPWDDVPRIYWDFAAPRFEALRATLPPGMKAVGGVGNGVFEISEDLVGFENLCYMQVDDPQLFAELYVKIGDLLVCLWTEFLDRFGDAYAVCRIGDDLGFKTSTLLAPQALIEHVIGQYRRIIRGIHNSGHPYLQHSCGKIFAVMEAWIDAGINAKHSNEDAVCPYDEWIERYGDRIGMFGGIDMDRVCRMEPDDLFEFVVEEGTRFRTRARGYALGTGNSIPDYVPVEGYLAMIRAAQEIRRREAAC